LKFNDAVIGIFFILFGGLLFYVTRDFPPMPGQAYGPDLFPRLIGATMIFAGALLSAKGLRDRRNRKSDVSDLRHENISGSGVDATSGGGAWAAPLEWMQHPRAVANFVLVIVVLVFYILASERLGFLITGFLCLLVLLIRLRGLSTWASSGVIALASALVIQMFFGRMLRVPLPWGVLQSYAW